MTVGLARHVGAPQIPEANGRKAGIASPQGRPATSHLIGGDEPPLVELLGGERRDLRVHPVLVSEEDGRKI